MNASLSALVVLAVENRMLHIRRPRAVWA